MSSKLNPPNFAETKDLLDNLHREVVSKGSKLTGGEEQEQTRGATAVQRLKETTVSFGNPRSRLIPLTLEGFEEKGVALNDEIKQLLKQFDFYSMVVTINPKPQPSVVISRLECTLDFGSKGQEQPMVHRIFPNSKWQTMVKAGVNLNVGLDANLDVGVGVDASELSKIANLPEYNKLKANVGTKDEFKAFMVLEGLNYQLGKFDIFAQGKNDSHCFWRIEKPELKGKSTVEFDVIFKVPKGQESIELVGNVWIEPDIDWLTGELSDVWSDLPSYLKDVFGSKKKAAKTFAVGMKEEWIDDLQIILPEP